jgi:hypothetical protein
MNASAASPNMSTEPTAFWIDRYYEPSEADVAAQPYVLATLSLQFTASPAALPDPPTAPTALLNRVVVPVLAAGDASATERAG